jgi:uncharacterized RDD family membrane protein YckC
LYSVRKITVPSRRFLKRVIATAIDWIGVPLVILLGGDGLDVELAEVMLVVALVGSAIMWFLSIKRSGNTWGKQIMGIRVLNDSRETPPLRSLISRELVKLGLMLTPLVVSFLWIIGDEQKQGWHEKLFRTYVIDQLRESENL